MLFKKDLKIFQQKRQSRKIFEKNVKVDKKCNIYTKELTILTMNKKILEFLIFELSEII